MKFGEFLNFFSEAGEMAQQLRALVGSQNTHWDLETFCSSRFETLFRPLWAPSAHVVHSNTQRENSIHIN